MQALKVKSRYFVGGSLGLFLRMNGSVERAKQRAFADRYVMSIYFHNPSKKLFEKCVKWLLRNDFSFITAEELIDILNGTSAPKRGSVWLSFDDGWKDNIVNVIPVIKEFKIPATFFISTDPIERTGVFWWTYVMRYPGSLPECYGANPDLSKTNEFQRKMIIEELSEKHGNQMERQAMTIDDIKTISSIDSVDIGSHTVNHVITPNCTDTELDFEIKRSIASIEKWTGKPVISFSYPNGDYDGREKKILKRYGIRLAATTRNGLAGPGTDPYYIPRFCEGLDEGTLSEAICHMLGIWRPFMGKIKPYIKG